MLKDRHFGMDAEIQRPGTAICPLWQQSNQANAKPSSYRPWHWIPASLLE